MVPFILVLLFTTVSFKAQSSETVSTVSPLSDPIRQVTLGMAYIMALMLLVFKLNSTLKSCGRNWIYFLSITYMLLSAMWSIFPGIVFITFVHNIGFAAIVLCAIYFIDDNIYRLLALFLTFSAAMVLGSIVLARFLPGRGAYYNGRWIGVSDQPNELGYICMISVWSAVAGIYFFKSKIIRFVNIILLGSTSICLYFSDSMTSMICSLFVIAAFLSLINRDLGKPRHPLIRLAIYTWSGVSILLVLYAFHPGLLRARAIFHMLGREPNLTGRTRLWALGEKALLKKPFLGWSFDSMASILSEGIISYYQFHNGYLNLAVSGGVPGLTLLILVLLRYARLSVRLLNTEYAVTASIGILVMSILIHNIAEASIMRVTHPLWLVFLLCYFYIDHLAASTRKQDDRQLPGGPSDTNGV